MMARTIGNAVCGHGGSDTSQAITHKPQNTAVCIGTQEHKIIPDDGKRAAMLRFNFGLCDFVDTQIAFVSHPDWRHA